MESLSIGYRHVAHRVLGVLTAIMIAHTAVADDSAYLRGYIDAILDTRFPGFGLRIKALSDDDTVTLSSRTCLGPFLKRDIVRTLRKTGRVKTVEWDASADCRAGAGDSEAAEATTQQRLVDVQLLPQRTLFAPLIADPRQPRFSISYQRYRTPSDEFNAASVAFGEYFGLASGFLGKAGASQIGIQGAVFALFNLDAPSNDLVNTDYWIGFPLSYRRGPWSALVRFYHQSSHLGDEFILGNPGVNRVNLSYEDLEALVSYEWEHWRLYGGGGYIVSSSPDLAPKHLQLGTEFIQPNVFGDLDLVAGLDIQASEELDWKRSYSYQAGLEFKSASFRQVRLVLEYFRGHSPNGQFFRQRLRYVGVGIYFGF